MPEQIERVDAAAFRTALSRFPSGVTIVTMRDADGTPWGFTASAFASLSLDPPLILVCLDRAADCHPAFVAAERFAVNVLAPAHAEIALRFATKGEDKYAPGGFEQDEHGCPVLPDAAAVIACELERAVPGGDHTILIGRVRDARAGNAEPVVWYRGDFAALERTA